MRLVLLTIFAFMSLCINGQMRFDVASGAEFSSAQQQAEAGDSIVWMSGVYRNTRMDVEKDGIIVTAEPHGSVLFTGSSRAILNGSHITFSGFQYIGGAIPSLNVIEINGSDVLFTEINIQNYTSRKYLIVDEESRRTTISHCNFENRLNLDDQNILSILVDNEPGYHKIQHCSFKNFDGIGNDQGIEPIRIGVSSQKLLNSRTLVEYCYFTRCNGDGEIISHKARQNVYRYNTFEDNPVAELVLRHGDEGIVYGNFFLNNMGGVRIREGSNHFVYNNYFEDLDRRAIYLQNESSDPLSEIHIYHNTIINSEEVRLGGSGSHPPTNVVFANNIFTNPKDQLFSQETGSETWIGNVAFGNLGIDSPSEGLIILDPMLSENSEGFFQPEINSPVLSSAETGYPEIPSFSGMEYDHELKLDLMQELRPDIIGDRAIGASEFSTETSVQPFATELNTGPSYLFDNLIDYIAANASQLYIGGDGESRTIYISSNVDWSISSDVDWITVDSSAGSGDSEIKLSIDPNNSSETRAGILTISGGMQVLEIDIFQDAGGSVSVKDDLFYEISVSPNPTDGMIKIGNLPSRILVQDIQLTDISGQVILSSRSQLQEKEIVIDATGIEAGLYLLSIYAKERQSETRTKLVYKIFKN